MLQRRTVILGAFSVAAAGLAAAGCSADGGGKTAGTWQSTAGPDPSGGSTPAAPPVTLTVTPEAGATKVSPSTPVVVAATGGKLQSVTVAAGSGRVSGAIQSDGTWRSTGALGYGKTYKVTASILDSTGTTVEKTAGFSTLKPDGIAGITFQANGLNALKTGDTYGIGQPVIVAFSNSVTDRAAAEKAIDIQATPAVEGKFYWVSNKIVHWRPSKYWAKGTHIKVSVNALGVNLGKGVYGANAATQFTIGRALLAISDNKTHRTKVYIDGKMVRDMACSNGRGGYTKTKDGDQIHFWTNNGPHVVLSKEQSHTMSSASFGVTDPKDPFYYAPEEVILCTRIS
jgi:hypothetical protein